MHCQWHSHWGGQGIATGGVKGASAPLTAKNLPKIRKKREKIRKKREKERKIGKGENWEGSFTLPLLTERAGYATAHYCQFVGKYTRDYKNTLLNAGAHVKTCYGVTSILEVE